MGAALLQPGSDLTCKEARAIGTFPQGQAMWDERADAMPALLTRLALRDRSRARDS